MAGVAGSRQEVIARLASAEAEIRGMGVRRLSLFGSYRRGEAAQGSDVDVLIEFDLGRKTFDRFLRVSELLEQLLGCPVEVVTTEAMSPYIGPHILAEAEDVIRAA